MERAGASDVTEDVERSGLGTPATRAETIEKIIRLGFAVRHESEKKKSKNGTTYIICTEAGMELISLAPEMLKSAKFTAEWEDGLARIAQGKTNPEDFMKEVDELVRDILKDAISKVDPSKIAPSDYSKEVVGKCPRCRGDVVEQPKSFACSNYKEKECKFALWKENKFLQSMKTTLTKEMAVALLKDGNIYIKGLYSAKADKKFNATIVLDDNGEYANFKLDFDSKPQGSQERVVVGKCPRCGGDVIELDKSFACSNYKEKGCNFALWKENKFFQSMRSKITKAIAIDLLRHGKAPVNDLYSAKKDKTFSAIVVLDDNGEYANFKLEFPQHVPTAAEKAAIDKLFEQMGVVDPEFKNARIDYE
jgi:DNA topoisomerase-3